VLLFASVLLLILARVSPPSFPYAISGKSTVKSCLQVEHRQCFDHCGLEWNFAPKVFQLAPRPALMLGLISGTEPIPAFYLKGFHYNRPPPTN
jgi:hypothetical protein